MRLEMEELYPLAAGVAALVAGGLAWRSWRHSSHGTLFSKGGSAELAAWDAADGPSAAATSPAAAANPGAQAEKTDGAEEGIWVYFGSQSGTAQGFAQELEQEAKARGLAPVRVVDLEEFEPERFVKHRCVVLVVATYGEGDPTDNAIVFFQWLSGLPPDSLTGVNFTVMGLGNKNYVNFNMMGKLADAQMERVGATRIHERGEGDDDANLEEDFERWKTDGLWKAVRVAIGDSGQDGAGPQGAVLDSPEEALAALPLRTLLVQADDVPMFSSVQNGGSCIIGKWYFAASEAPVVVCNELRQNPDVDAGLSTKHVEFDVQNLPALDWRTADNLEVLPSNSVEDVEWFAARFGAAERLNDTVVFASAPNVKGIVRKPFPAPCVLRQALSLYCDLGGPPTRVAMRKLGALVRDSDERQALSQLLEDAKVYQWLTGDSVRLSLRELLELYLPTSSLDIGPFLQLCPRQRSRPYTISSSSREDPHRIGICVSVVHSETLPSLAALLQELKAKGHGTPPGAARMLARGGKDTPRRFRGCCSNYLCNDLKVGDRLWLSSRPSSFRLPRRVSTPVVMIGTGTGLAPFRGFLREFRMEKPTRIKTYLFFGCTRENDDYIYREDLEEAYRPESLSGRPRVLTELVLAFSREQNEKVYVQHRLREHAELLATLHKEGAYFYVCGSVKMGQAAREALVEALGPSVDVGKLAREGRLVEELW